MLKRERELGREGDKERWTEEAESRMEKGQGPAQVLEHCPCPALPLLNVIAGKTKTIPLEASAYRLLASCRINAVCVCVCLSV